MMTRSEPTLVPGVDWQFDPEQDANDGMEWSAADLEDLALALKDGGSIEGAAYFLSRAGTIEDVRRKAAELRLIASA